MFNFNKTKLFGATVVTSLFATFASAEPVNVDLSAAETAIGTAGNSMITVVVGMLALSLVIGFLMKRA